MLRLQQILGKDLCNASIHNNLARVTALTLGNEFTNWSIVMLAAAYGSATDVVAYTLQQTHRLCLIDGAMTWIAGSADYDDAFRFLVNSHNVEPNYYMEHRGTPLGILSGTGKANRHSIVRFLLDRGANPNHTVEMQCHKSILACAAMKSDPQMLTILLDHGARLNGSGALVSAAERGNLDNVKTLIVHGADLNEMGVRTYDRRTLAKLGTALHKAIENGHIATAYTLIQAGANCGLRDAQGRTAAGIAIQKGLDARLIEMLQHLGRLHSSGAIPRL